MNQSSVHGSYLCYESPMGPILLVEKAGKLVRTDFMERSNPRISPSLTEDFKQVKTRLLSETQNQLEEYFEGRRTEFELPYHHKNNEQLNFQFYFGPNHYKILKSYDANFEELIPLGWGIFGWVNQ